MNSPKFQANHLPICDPIPRTKNSPDIMLPVAPGGAADCCCSPAPADGVPAAVVTAPPLFATADGLMNDVSTLLSSKLLLLLLLWPLKLQFLDSVPPPLPPPPPLPGTQLLPLPPEEDFFDFQSFMTAGCFFFPPCISPSFSFVFFCWPAATPRKMTFHWLVFYFLLLLCNVAPSRCRHYVTPAESICQLVTTQHAQICE